jgi:hypothetical protein
MGYVEIDRFKMDSQVKESDDGQPLTIEPIHLQSAKIKPVTDITEHDILLGRGKSNANHIGNVLFQGKSTNECLLTFVSSTSNANLTIFCFTFDYLSFTSKQ